MHVIKKIKFVDAASQYPNYSTQIMDLYQILKRFNFGSPDDMRKVYKSLDNFKYKDKHYVLDIAGNNIRLIAYISFSGQRFYAKHIVSHAEYDKLTKRYAKGELWIL